MMDWKDINIEQPKDGEFVLTYELGRGIDILCWNEDFKCWDDHYGDDYYSNDFEQIKYWMKLPDAPENN